MIENLYIYLTAMLQSLPIVLENMIYNYKYGSEHFDGFNKSLQKIKEIKHEYKYDAESECYETKVIKNDIETYYYMRDDWFEVESAKVGSSKFIKYWYFLKDKLETLEICKA